jgi:hypothetical protein
MTFRRIGLKACSESSIPKATKKRQKRTMMDTEEKPKRRRKGVANRMSL